MHDPSGGPRGRAPRWHALQACGRAHASPLTAPWPRRASTYCLPRSPGRPFCTHAALYKHDCTVHCDRHYRQTSLLLRGDNGIRRRRRRRRHRHRRRRCSRRCRRRRRRGGRRRRASPQLCAGCRTPLLGRAIPPFPALCFPPCHAAILALTTVAPYPLYRDHVSPRTSVGQLGAAHGWAHTTRLSVAHATSTSPSHPQPLATAMDGHQASVN